MLEKLEAIKVGNAANGNGKAANGTQVSPPKGAQAYAAPHEVPKTPSPPSVAVPVVDLLGGDDFANDAFGAAPARAPAPAPTNQFADFGDFSAAPAAPAAAAPAEADLLGGFASFAAPPPAAPSSGGGGSNAASFANLDDLFGPPGAPAASMSSGSLDAMMGAMGCAERTQPGANFVGCRLTCSLGRLCPALFVLPLTERAAFAPRPHSVVDELNMATPLMPEGAGGGPMLPERRLKLPGAMDANAPPEPEESQSQLEKRVAAWQEGKNLQALLSSLHTIAPKCCRWQPRTLGELLDEDKLRDAYKLSLVAVHPDKLDKTRPEWERARCQLIFNALRKNRPRSTNAAPA